MEQLILASYKSLAITSLMAFILGLTVLAKCYKDRTFNNTFCFALALSLGWLGEFIMRVWFTMWKERHISREPSSWMQDHGIVLFACCLMIASGLLFIKTLTEDSEYGIIWVICAFVSFTVFWMSYV